MSTDETSGQDSRGTDLKTTLCDDGRHIMARNTRSGSGDVHTVSLSESGDVVGCSCDGWNYNQTCYHVDHVQDSPLLLSSARATVASSQRVATDGGHKRPTRSEPADFGGGEASGMDKLGDFDDVSTDESDDVDSEDSTDDQDGEQLPEIEDVGDHRCRCTGCSREGVKDLDREPVILHTRDCPNAEDDR